MARIAIVTQRLQGHVLPIIQIGVQLTRLGHEVWLLSHHSVKFLAIQNLLHFHAIGWDRFPEYFIEEMLEDVSQFINLQPIDLIINDSSLSAPAIAAELYCIPSVSIQTSLPLSDKAVPGSQSVNLRLMARYQRKLDQIRANNHLPPTVHPFHSRGDLAGLSSLLHLVLVYPELIDLDFVINHPTFRYVGSCPMAVPPQSNHLSKPKRKDDKFVIVVCTSSVPRVELKEITNLYVNTCSTVFRRPVFEVIISGNPRLASITTQEPSISFPTHHEIFPQADLVITHGGCGTLQSCLLYGIPMIIIPLGADHSILADQCSKLGVSKTLNPDEILESTLYNHFLEIQSDPTYRLNALAISNKVRTYNAQLQSAKLITELLEGMKNDD
ncbi:UDP:flavonoid glycosyltransferase YjiC (YdhE family) [Paenibacillus cellulosilyticus]|uniref:UDP:flavonoid glycosyltransferase YjiC (YdhE family) n=1 Tax=Paenibacillus cellulosilyticus TaxID=375489 RepID=A0A2V2Z2Z4_9BACL|nr:nucleotide disphospho-sugar-binding domain-containing protein [Paenibacillus cellulosilyticus]PWW03204.1 UDP:flavonoid glycosyltransferase YjiC (YdhE family) [Paenibacillus cellulosilyticus]QKS43694.1 hypothetical protein HUB94_04035 [Paenibacillus cellulosilyticus]